MELILVEFYGSPKASPTIVGLFSDDEKADTTIEDSIKEMRKHNVGYEKFCTVSDYGKITLTVDRRIFL